MKNDESMVSSRVDGDIQDLRGIRAELIRICGDLEWLCNRGNEMMRADSDPLSLRLMADKLDRIFKRRIERIKGRA